MNLLHTSGASALSMTLLHSLWQGLVITSMAGFFIKVFATQNSSAKYFIKTGAFFLIFASSLVTFVILSQPQKGIISSITFSEAFSSTIGTSASSGSYLEMITNYLQTHQSWIVLGWAMGAFLFSLRFAAGIAYLKYLRIHSLPVENNWNETLKKLSARLGIDRLVQLYESIQVKTPVTMGYLKPIILMPIGLMSGLNTQQVEVILIHELEHIRRHDYLINFIQSLGETIFFFNPFVWILSASIRNERENCCDDAVLREGYDPQLYATTLFELESLRFENATLALSLAGNKNQLLNRIKRIMEQSAKNQKGKEKFIPLVLLVLGLVFASWLSINPNEVPDASKKMVSADTSVSPKKSMSYSRKSIVTYDEQGKPHEEMAESFEGDESFSKFYVAPDFNLPELPEMIEFAELAEMTELEAMPEMYKIDEAFPQFETVSFPVLAFPSVFPLNTDTLPDMNYFERGMDREKMKEFESNFKKQFKEKFGDFYSKNRVELEKIMADAEQKMAMMDERMAANMEILSLQPPMAEEQINEARVAQKLALEQMLKSEGQMKVMVDQLRKEELNLKVMEENMKQFEKELTQQLIRDGYLKKGETMDGVNFNFTDEGIRINGQKIKSADEPKYKELHKKYFNSKPRGRHRPE
jgi:bla regulator protein BlaR1